MRAKDKGRRKQQWMKAEILVLTEERRKAKDKGMSDKLRMTKLQMSRNRRG